MGFNCSGWEAFKLACLYFGIPLIIGGVVGFGIGALVFK